LSVAHGNRVAPPEAPAGDDLTLKLKTSLVLIALCCLWPGLSTATEAEVRAAIGQVFDGMRSADASMVRAVVAEDARFVVIEGEPATLRVESPERWLEAIDASGGAWDERTYDIQISVDGPMASAWVPYTFYRDGSLSHCGINSIELLKDAEGRKITQISDTRRSEGCPDSP
jgi:hypothetical protein